MKNNMILSQSEHSRSETIAKKIRDLQSNHRDLQETLRQKIYSLNLQINLDKTQNKQQIIEPSLTIIQQLINSQSQVTSYFSQSLLNSQIKVQEQGQMKEIVKNYEKRIMDLRAILINKQGEITIETYQRKRDTIVRRQNLQVINGQTNQKITINRYLKQIKKLQVQIQAIEFTLNKNIKSTSKKETSDLHHYLKTEKDLSSIQHYQNTMSKSKLSTVQRQQLINHLNMMFAEEDKRNQIKLKELQKLKADIEKANNLSKILKKKYHKLEKERVKISMNNQQQHNKNFPQMNILQQLQEQQQSSRDQKIFYQKDSNTQQLEISSKKGISLKQRKIRSLKQNC